MLLVGFENPEGEPDYIRLIRVYEDREDTCEIGTDDLDEFLSRNGYEG